MSLLLDRAERQLARQSLRIDTLKAHAELQAGRLANGDPSRLSAQQTMMQRQQKRDMEREKAERRKSRPALGLRAKATRQRKEALVYSLERLEMELAQKEAELRSRVEGQ